MNQPDGMTARIDERNRRAWDLMLSAPEEALSLAVIALEEAEASSYAFGICEARLNIGWCECYLNRLGPAIVSFQKALEGFTGLNDAEGAMKCLNALGVAYSDLGRFDKAMDYYTRSLEQARSHGNTFREAATLNNIGEVCLRLGELKEALDYFLRAYEIVTSDQETEVVSDILLNIGTTFLRMENWPLAREFTERALAIAEEMEDLLTVARSWLILGMIASSSERYDLAETYCGRALDIATKLKNEKERALALLELGALHAHRGETTKALERYREALAGAEAIGAKGLIHQAYERLSEAYEALGDFKTALEYYRNYARFERETLSEDTSRKIKNITVQYEVEKSRQEAEIYRLRNIELKEKTQELEEANRQILSISELGRRITSSLDLDTVITTLYESLKRHVDATVFGIAVHDHIEDLIEWKIFIHQGKRIHRPVIKPDYERSLAAWCLRNRQLVFITDAEHEYQQYLTGMPIVFEKPSRSIVYVPLIIEDRAIGTLTVQSYEKGAYTEKHRRFFEALGPYVSIALENGLIHDRLEELNRVIMGEKAELELVAAQISQQANHDSLTGLPNRRLLFELLQKSFDIALRNGTKVGVAFVDLDDFKPINDRFGHSAGDRALVDIANRLRNMLRSSDTVARVGGDEFILVLTNIKDVADLELAAAKILQECQAPLSIVGESCKVGLSMGIAIFPDHGMAIEDIVNRADAAMYRIKHARKNGFGFWDAEMEAPLATAERDQTGTEDGTTSSPPVNREK